MTNPQEHICVEVKEVNGNIWELYVEPQTTVASFKERLATFTGVPTVLQKLVIDEEVPKNSEVLATRRQLGVAAVSVTMVTRIDGLESSSHLKRQITLNAIAQLVSRRGDVSDGVVDYVVRCFADGQSFVRWAAMEAWASAVIAQAEQQGYDRAITATKLAWRTPSTH